MPGDEAQDEGLSAVQVYFLTAPFDRDAANTRGHMFLRTVEL